MSFRQKLEKISFKMGQTARKIYPWRLAKGARKIARSIGLPTAFETIRYKSTKLTKAILVDINEGYASEQLADVTLAWKNNPENSDERSFLPDDSIIDINEALINKHHTRHAQIETEHQAFKAQINACLQALSNLCTQISEKNNGGAEAVDAGNWETKIENAIETLNTLQDQKPESYTKLMALPCEHEVLKNAVLSKIRLRTDYKEALRNGWYSLYKLQGRDEVLVDEQARLDDIIGTLEAQNDRLENSESNDTLQPRYKKGLKIKSISLTLFTVFFTSMYALSMLYILPFAGITLALPTLLVTTGIVALTFGTAALFGFKNLARAFSNGAWGKHAFKRANEENASIQRNYRGAVGNTLVLASLGALVSLSLSPFVGTLLIPSIGLMYSAILIGAGVGALAGSLTFVGFANMGRFTKELFVAGAIGLFYGFMRGLYPSKYKSIFQEKFSARGKVGQVIFGAFAAIPFILGRAGNEVMHGIVQIFNEIGHGCLHAFNLIFRPSKATLKESWDTLKNQFKNKSLSVPVLTTLFSIAVAPVLFAVQIAIWQPIKSLTGFVYGMIDGAKSGWNFNKITDVEKPTLFAQTKTFFNNRFVINKLGENGFISSCAYFIASSIFAAFATIIPTIAPAFKAGAQGDWSEAWNVFKKPAKNGFYLSYVFMPFVMLAGMATGVIGRGARFIWNNFTFVYGVIILTAGHPIKALVDMASWVWEVKFGFSKKYTTNWIHVGADSSRVLISGITVSAILASVGKLAFMGIAAFNPLWIIGIVGLHFIAMIVVQQMSQRAQDASLFSHKRIEKAMDNFANIEVSKADELTMSNTNNSDSENANPAETSSIQENTPEENPKELLKNIIKSIQPEVRKRFEYFVVAGDPNKSSTVAMYKALLNGNVNIHKPDGGLISLTNAQAKSDNHRCDASSEIKDITRESPDKRRPECNMTTPTGKQVHVTALFSKKTNRAEIVLAALEDSPAQLGAGAL